MLNKGSFFVSDYDQTVESNLNSSSVRAKFARVTVCQSFKEVI